jgi:hypothetical protein
MSTVKSDNSDLTINASGSTSDIKFQANGVEKASISSAGAFTSTTIDATKLTGNLPAISGASLTNLPAGGGGSWEFVSRTNVSTTVAGVEFTGLASQPHLLVFEAFVPVSTSAAYLSITVSNDNGSTYYSSGYRWSNSLWSDTSNNSFTASSSDSSLRISTTGDNSNSTQGFNGQIMMFNINDSTQKFMQTSTIVHVSDGHYCRQGVGGGIHDTAAAINAIKLAFHTGNINGHAKCYVTLYKQIIS